MVTDRRYGFNVPVERLWSTLTQIDQYRAWWPWLRRFEGADLAPDQRWLCAVQPPLSYPVRFAILIDEVRAPHGASATITGDVVGTARIDVLPTDIGCEARLVSRLAPGNGLLRLASRFAAPMVRLGHDWVLDAAARQFAERAL